MSEPYDLIVIGSGTAATAAAMRCAKKGWRVAMVDKRPFGGTCALRGCDPKKLLRRGAEIVEGADLLRGQGISGAGPRIDWAALVARKDRFTEAMQKRKLQALEQAGIDMLHGVARFTDTHQIEVAGTPHRARKFVIATGATARPLDVPGAKHLLDNEDFMNVEELPPRILFVGGGYISFEFAHIAARAGSEVIVLDSGERPLRGFDPDLVEKLVERSQEAGITLKRNAQLLSIRRSNGRYTVTYEENGAEHSKQADLVVHGAGRLPEIAELNLEAAGVPATENGVKVNTHLQSVGNPDIYAAGDAADTAGAPLTPVAAMEGEIVAENLLGGQASADYHGVPSVVYTIPELARVGLLQSEAEEQELNVEIVDTDASEWFSNFRVGENTAAAKILIDKDTDRFIGAHMLGPGYGELINFIALAMRLGLTRAQLAKASMAYPTIGSDLSSMF